MAKLYGHWMTVNFRESYGLYTCSGILFNHESPRRGYEFVTRKITRGVARIALGMQERIVLGNLDARRDWGFAGDYVEAMWRLLQQEEGGDYVIATGVARSVREFVETAFRCAGIEDWRRYVEEDEGLRRPAEVEELVGDASKAEERLGWKAKTTFVELVEGMVRCDMEEGERERSSGGKRR